MKRREIARKFDEIVAFAEIEKFLDTPVKHYSSGMYMRLAFAVAAHLEPEILLVDEVLAVGDAEFQKKCLGKMGEVAREGRTVLFVSHNMGAVQGLCARTILLREGELLRDGATAETVTAYIAATGSGHTFMRKASVNRAVYLRSADVEIYESPNGPVLRVTTVLNAQAHAAVSVDIRIVDARGVAVGFAPVGSFNSSQEIALVPGRTRIMSEHDASMLASGCYTISIDVADPTAAYHDRVDTCLSFEIVSPPRAGSYRRLDQNWGFGSIEFAYLSHHASPCHD
jgi:lipopolysaccharide transport system ATP-binding protein